MSRTRVVVSLVLCWCFAQSLFVNAIHSSETQHRTKAASEKQHDLWCHRCDSMIESDKCLNLSANHSSLHQKCSKEQKKCLVRRISMSTSTEEVTGRPKLWLLQRNCSETCEAGCIIIGERTKLHSCITCCDEHNFCNAGNVAGKKEVTGRPKLWLLQRNCSETCEAGCIIIGERTKLHSCITCCDEHNFCNAGNVAGRNRFQGTFPLPFFYIVFFYVSYK